MHGVAAPATRRPRVLPADVVQAGAVVVAFTALIWAVEFLDRSLDRNLEHDGIRARHLDGLDGVLWAPLLHGPWSHLLTNTAPVLLLGFLVLADGVGRWASITGLIWVVAGTTVWLVGESGYHLGASGLVFGWLTYLLARGFFAWDAKQIGFAVVLGIGAGSMLWSGLTPGQAGVSWVGHMAGAAVGVLAAALFSRRAAS